MKWNRTDCANWRIKWEAEERGHQLLIVREKARGGPVYWWRIRKDGKNVIKGNGRGFKDSTQRVRKSFKDLEASWDS